MRRASQHGIALVITLIMLSVVTVMAVIFLGISRRERASVGVTANLTDARLATDAGIARAQAELIAQIAARTNLFAYDLIVSTNYINPNGFVSGNTNPANVSYTYANGNLLTDADHQRNVANLLFDPRPPVYITTTNRNASGQLLKDFRFYLDLNRNGFFDTNSPVNVYTNGRRSGLTNRFIGDPEWIGVLERPDQPHGPKNRFIARYAYIALPAGKSLDVNYAHNNGVSYLLGPEPLRYRRNQGVGTWELNLAAFLQALLPRHYTNEYAYRQWDGLSNAGEAFQDAGALLSYRYGHSALAFLQRASDRFALLGAALRSNGIDDYGDNAPPTATIWPYPEIVGQPNSDDPDAPWPGSDQPRAFQTIDEFYDLSKTTTRSLELYPNPLTFKLLAASTTTGHTEDQYVLGRLLAQLGTDSPRPRQDLIHLNYANAYWDLVERRTVLEPSAVAALKPWTLNSTTKRDFVHLAADRLLRTQLGLSLQNGIPVYPTNYYNAAVHRIVQLAVNLLDTMDNAPTNRFGTATNAPYLPSVYRPVYAATNLNGVRNLLIVGFTDARFTNALSYTWRDPANPTDMASMVTGPDGDNIYGIPWVVGARKGWPNFNEFSLQTELLVTRRLQGVKDNSGAVQYQQSYEIGISNSLGFEMWNSYTQAFPGLLTVHYTNVCRMALRDNNLDPTGTSATGLVRTNTLVNYGRTQTNFLGRQFHVLTNSTTFIQNSEYWPGAGANALRPLNDAVTFDGTRGFPVPDWKLLITNRFMFALATTTGRLVDVVTLSDQIAGFDVTQFLIGSSNLNPSPQVTRLSHGDFWLTNRVGGLPTAMTYGLTNQIFVSTNNNTRVSDWADWTIDRMGGSQDEVEKQIDAFRIFLGLPPLFDPGRTNMPPNRVVQVPFSPTRRLVQQLSWMANDPLVHYHVEDLADPVYSGTNQVVAVPPSFQGEIEINGLPNLGQINLRYRPWGGRPGTSADDQAYETAVKDPMIRCSDDWDLLPPTTNTFLYPNVGWIGRVHRGTPWQTVYLKSKAIPVLEWQKLAGRRESHPTNDWRIVEEFTTALSENALRGRLSVNQTNLAAWAAVLGGVNVFSNTSRGLDFSLATSFDSHFVDPVGPQLRFLVNNLNTNRLTRRSQTYNSLGEVLSAPALTDESPYLNLAGIHGGQVRVTDAIYERIPQQILGLLKEDEPYIVVYSYGQSLRPADRSLVLSPTPADLYLLCTNYQIAGEAVAKATFRIEQHRVNTNIFYDAVMESYTVLPLE